MSESRITEILTKAALDRQRNLIGEYQTLLNAIRRLNGIPEDTVTVQKKELLDLLTWVTKKLRDHATLSDRHEAVRAFSENCLKYIPSAYLLDSITQDSVYRGHVRQDIDFLESSFWEDLEYQEDGFTPLDFEDAEPLTPDADPPAE